MTIIEIEKNINETESKIKTLNEEHEARMHNLNSEKSRLIKLRQHFLDGLDVVKIQNAQNILKVYGNVHHAGSEIDSVLEGIKNDLLELYQTLKAPTLNREGLLIQYRGTKDYDRWHGQGFQCRYGYSPSYGSVIFSIGLHRDLIYKIEVLDEVTRLFVLNHIEDCLYYIGNIYKIHKKENQ